MRNPARQVYEFNVQDKYDVDRPVIFIKNGFCDEKDQVAGIIGVFLDITERKHVVEEIKKLNQEPDAACRHIEWRIGDLSEVSADAAMLRLVLVNLVANALKFTRPRRQAQIEIGSLPGQDAEAVVFVRDNGVGFDMTNMDKLFGVFQRLHRGRTWAEGKVDQGAAFFFSLPQM